VKRAVQRSNRRKRARRVTCYDSSHSPQRPSRSPGVALQSPTGPSRSPPTLSRPRGLRERGPAGLGRSSPGRSRMPPAVSQVRTVLSREPGGHSGRRVPARRAFRASVEVLRVLPGQWSTPSTALPGEGDGPVPAPAMAPCEPASPLGRRRAGSHLAMRSPRRKGTGLEWGDPGALPRFAVPGAVARRVWVELQGRRETHGRHTQHPEGGERRERPYRPRIHLSYWR